MPRRVVSTVDWSATDGVGVVVGDVVGVKEGVIVGGWIHCWRTGLRWSDGRWVIGRWWR